MDVQPERAGEQSRRNVEPVGADDDTVHVARQLRLLRLVDGDAELERDVFRGRCGELAAATAAARPDA